MEICKLKKPFSMKGKKTLLPLLALLIVAPLAAQKKNNDLHEQNLLGKVKSVEEWEYNAETADGKVVIDKEMGAVSHHMTQFNRRGNVEEEKSYDSEGKQIGKTKYKYSEVGDLMESSEYNEKGKCFGRSVYTYNSYRQPATLTLFRSDGTMETGTYHYGSAKQLDSLVWKGGKSIRREIYLYNKALQLSEKQVLEGGQCTERTSYQYDEAGRIVKETHSTADGKQHSTLSAYDADGRLKSVTQQGAAGLQESRTCWEYDKNGNILVETWYNEHNVRNVRSTCEYTYDEEGNWTQQLWYDDGKAFSIIQRKLIYY